MNRSISLLEHGVPGRLQAPASPSPADGMERVVRFLKLSLPPELQSLVEHQVANLPPLYFRNLDGRSIEEDFGLLRRLEAEPLIVLLAQSDRHAILKVAMRRNEPRIFLRVVGTLARNRLGIERASIFIGRRDSAVLEHFYLSKSIPPGTLQKVADEVREALSTGRFHEPDLPPPVGRGMFVVVDNQISPADTVLVITAEDQTGFLYRLSRVFSESNCRLIDAKINTVNNKIQDSFHLVNSEGGKLRAPQEVEDLRRQICQAFGVAYQAPRQAPAP